MTPLDPALLRAVLANPEEDLPRLLCAEWLDENAEMVECGRCYGSGWSKPGPTNEPKCHNCGNSSQNATPIDSRNMRRCASCKMLFEPLYCPTCSGSGRVSDGAAERAEFIRVQVELARLEATVEQWANTPSDQPGGTAEDGGAAGAALAESQALRRRERELFKLVPLWWDMGFKATHWSRGFVSEIELTCEQFMRHAPAIFAAMPVTEVRLTDREPEDDRGHMWFRGDGEGAGIPVRIWDEINVDVRVDWGEYFKGFETADLARAALSAACVNRGRALVGLPPLPPRTETEVTP